MPTLSNGDNRWEIATPNTPDGVDLSGPLTIVGTPVNDTTMIISISASTIVTSQLVPNNQSTLYMIIPNIIPNQYRPKRRAQIGIGSMRDTAFGGSSVQFIATADQTGSITIQTTASDFIHSFGVSPIECPGMTFTVARRD